MASQSATRLATVRERAQAQALSAPTGVAPGRGRSGDVDHVHCGKSRTWGAEHERSVSTHAMQKQFGELYL
eukprot:2081550-Pleurochrysis_carterae.AAC.2